MQLRVTTDYAIRILLHLAVTKQVTTSMEIAESMGIPPKYLMKIVKELREGGLVGAEQGMHGGYYLAKDPERITMLEVLKLMEPTMNINRCLEEDRFCSRNATAYCPVHKYMQRLQDSLTDELQGTTLKDIMAMS